MADNNQELKEAKKLLLELNQLRDKLGREKLNLLDANLLKIAKDLPNDIKSARRELEGMSDSMSGLYGSLRGITSEFKGQATVLNKVRGAFRQLEDIAQDLKFDEQEINDLNTSQLRKLEQKFKRNQQILEQEARAVINQNDFAKVLNKNVQDLIQQGKTQDEINEHISTYLSNTKKLSDEQKSLLQLYYDQGNTVDEINKKLNNRIQKEKEINDALGIGGAAVQGINSMMSKLGMNSSAFSDAVQEAEEAMRNTAKDGGSRLQVLMAGLGPLAKGFGKALTDPLVVIQFIVAELLKGSQNMADFRKQTGMGAVSAYKLNMEMKGVAAASGDNFITSEKLNKSFATLTQQLGVSADILGGDALVSATNLEQRLGMSAEQASKLTVFTRLQGKDTENILSRSTKIVGAYNMQNKTAINTRAVLDDVANTSNATYLTMGKNVEALTQAATQAQALGLSMKQIEQISESMLNFEDSIGKELEAQLLTGGNINLAKAREYALTGDMVGLTNEIQKQEGIMDAFRSKNVIAQKAAADALGISREELAGMALKQDLATMSAEQFKDAYGETTYESMKARSASEKFADAIEKVKDILGSIIQVFSPILDILASLLNIPLVPYILAGIVAIKVLGFSISGVGKAFGSMFSMGKQALLGIANFAKAPIQGLKAIGSKLAGGFGVGTGDMVQAKSGKFYGKDSPQGKMISNLSGKAGEATEAAKKIPEKSGGGMSSLTDSIQKIKPSQLLAGGAALIMIAVAVYIFAKAAQEFATVSWEDMAKAGLGLLGLVAALAAVGAIMMSGVGALAILAGAAAIVIMAGGLFILGLALQGVGKGMTMMEPALALVSSIGDKAAGLATVGASLLGIADGLREIGAAGAGAIPVLQELNKIGTTTTASAGGKTAGSAKGKAEEGSMTAVAQKLDVLIELARKGTVVMLDGKVLATSNAQNQKQVLSNQR